MGIHMNRSICFNSYRITVLILLWTTVLLLLRTNYTFGNVVFEDGKRYNFGSGPPSHTATGTTEGNPPETSTLDDRITNPIDPALAPSSLDGSLLGQDQDASTSSLANVNSAQARPPLPDVAVRWFQKKESRKELKDIVNGHATRDQELVPLIRPRNKLTSRLLGYTAEASKPDDEDRRRRVRRSFMDLWYDDYDIFEIDCEYPPCPVWSTWHGSGACNATCGGGTRLLVRYCENAKHDEYQGGCEGDNTKIEECNTQACPEWTSWKQSGECSTTCGKGIANYTRKCMAGDKPAYGCMGPESEYRLCLAKQACPPQWTQWSQFSPCTKSCGRGGYYLRRRACIVDGNPYSGTDAPCKGVTSQPRRCRFETPCQPRFSQWSDWSTCNAVTCGVPGRQKRIRHCLAEDGSVLPKNKMNCKPERLYQRRSCQGKPCATGCTLVVANVQQVNDTARSNLLHHQPKPTWSQWTDWNACSITCGTGGRQMRSRMCFGVKFDEKNNTFVLAKDKSCKGEPIESRRCEFDINCPHWDQWQEWNECTTTCGFDGRQERARNCVIEIYENRESTEDRNNFIPTTIREHAIGSKEYSANDDEWPIPATLLPNASVHITNLSIRHDELYLEKTVLLEPNFCHGGADSSKMIRTCNDRACSPPWGEWQSWSDCDVTCGKGQMTRVRECLANENCHGDKHELRTCYQPPCWGEWTAYSPCTASCGDGAKIRYRKCRGITEHMPEYTACTGEHQQNVSCNTQPCPKWGEWNQWLQCSRSCGGGTRTRTRKCEVGDCRGRDTDFESCNYQPCPYWDEWSSFSCCSVTCGKGLKERNRRCRHGQPGARGCPGSDTDKLPCDAGSCNVTTPPALNSSQCGVKPAKEQFRPILRIFNGKTSDEHEWPWQASWQHFTCIGGIYDCKWEHLCGATLLGPKWVITAGHCIEEWDYRVIYDDPGDTWSVMIRMTKLNQNGDRYYLKRVIMHPEYEYSDYSGVPRNDLALLQLKKSVPINEHAMPACLPETSRPEKNTNCYISGWGNLYPRSQLSRSLLHAKLPVLEFTDCQKLGYYYETYLTKNMHLCAGDAKNNGAADSCKGDSGGPMVCLRDDGKWYLAGVTSFGFVDCGTQGNVGVYVPMTEFEGWVKATTERYSKNGC